MYLEILRSYALSMTELLDALEHVSGDTLADYAITVHGIKGTSYQICAQELGNEAAVLEAAAKAGDRKTIEERNGNFVRALKTLLENLEAFLETAIPREAAAGEAVEKNAEKTGAPDRALLDRMLQACKDYDMTAMEEALTRLEARTYTSTPGNELVRWLRKQVDNVEYEAIRERLEKGETRE
jgi:hypothetical protein